VSTIPITRTTGGHTASLAPGAARQALKDTLPFAAALIPFAFAIGGASASAGLSAFEAQFGATVLLAGAAQLAAIDLISSGEGMVVTIVMVALINVRFVFYGAGLARWFSEIPLPRRLPLAVPLVDQNFMLCQERFADKPDIAWRQQYYLTSSAVLVGTFLSC